MNREGVTVRRSPFRWPQLILGLVFLLIVAAGLYCGYLAFSMLRDFAARAPIQSISVAGLWAPIAQAGQEESRPEQPEARPEAPRTSVVIPDVRRQERVNVLVLGIDQRPGESAACRTDTMILASINPQDMTASLLSIPRDLWLEIPHPNHEKDRVNTAHFWGETEGYPGGGPALAMKTVEYNFGVRVHYYVRINFVGFERIIDTIGGIDVDVPLTIDDDRYPSPANGYEHLHIDAGLQHFDGTTALKYARTRKGTGDGDFSRMERQQQVILAIRDRVLNLKNLPQLLFQAPTLLREMGDAVETNIPFDQLIPLAQLAQRIERGNIRTATISRDVTSDWLTPKGEMVLLYDRARARPLIDDLFGDPTPEAQVTEVSPVAQLESEAARVSLRNRTATEGLAERIAAFLTMQGIDVYEVDDQTDAGAAPLVHEHTVVQLYGVKPYTTEWIVGWLREMGLPEPAVEQPLDQHDADIVIIVGSDFPADTMN